MSGKNDYYFYWINWKCHNNYTTNMCFQLKERKRHRNYQGLQRIRSRQTKNSRTELSAQTRTPKKIQIKVKVPINITAAAWENDWHRQKEPTKIKLMLSTKLTKTNGQRGWNNFIPKRFVALRLRPLEDWLSWIVRQWPASFSVKLVSLVADKKNDLSNPRDFN